MASCMGVSIVFYVSAVAFHRLWISHLSKFPGPRLAAITFWYEFYYDVWPGTGLVSAGFSLIARFYSPLPVHRQNPRTA